MKKPTIERIMFYNAKPDIFQKAAMLRQNMTKAEKILLFSAMSHPKT